MRLLSDRVEEGGGVSEMTESEIENYKEGAKAEIAFLNETRQMVLEQHSHSFKWITASLLAINGAAAISILNTDKLIVYWKIYSGIFFCIGILLALLVAVSAQKISLKGLIPIQRQIGYWISVSYDGERVEAVETELNKEFAAAMRFSWLVPALGWLSALMFVVGLGVSAKGLLQTQLVAVQIENEAIGAKHAKPQTVGNDR